jgi:bleomycin hydrolase
MKLKSIIFLLLSAWTITSFGQEVVYPTFEIKTSAKSTAVKSQGRTGTCWSFSTSSFLESEFMRINGEEIDLSEMYTVRNIYLEKGEKYLRYHGTCNFSQGSLAHDVINSYKKYGMMPESAYTGLTKDTIHNHTLMEKELKAYLDSTLKSTPIDLNWKEGFIAIMDAHLGGPPAMFTYEGVLYTPFSFAEVKLKLNADDYIGFTSFARRPNFSRYVIPIPDNFSDGVYVNLSLEDFMLTIDNALEKGYSVEWDGDVSEQGFMSKYGVALYTNDSEKLAQLPVIPQEDEVDDHVRQELFDNHSTTDDHLMHITGIAYSPDGKKFYVTKNSWGPKSCNQGYMYMSEAYVQMKTISILIHKDAVPARIKSNI